MGRPNPESEVWKGPQRRERFQGGESAEGIVNVLSVSRLTLSSKDKRLYSFILKASLQTSWWGDDNIDPLADSEMPLPVVTQRDCGLAQASARGLAQASAGPSLRWKVLYPGVTVPLSLWQAVTCSKSQFSYFE